MTDENVALREFTLLDTAQNQVPSYSYVMYQDVNINF